MYKKIIVALALDHGISETALAKGSALPADERATTFDEMIVVALETVVA